MEATPQIQNMALTRKLMAAADCQPTSRFVGTLPPAFQNDGLSPPPAGAVPFHSFGCSPLLRLVECKEGLQGGSSYRSRPMNVFDLQAEAVRCPDCALVGIASLTEKSSARKIKRLPKGFKVITTDEGDQIYCAACNRPAITLIIDP
jgi:hypothetical protein